MVDIARDARWGRIVEGSGEDPYLGSAIAAAYVHGYQGTHLDEPDSIAACVKHFAGYGAVTAGREYNAVDMSPLTLQQFYLPPYHAGVDAGAATIMSAFNTLNGVPSTASSFLLRETLRDRWKFPGVVVSDWGAVPQLQAHGVANSPEDAARKAMLAGLDMDMVGKVYPQFLPSLVREGRVPLADVDDAVRRVLQLKADLGLFEQPYFDLAGANQSPSQANLKLAQRAAAESMVLLKNSAVPQHPAVLPLRANQSIALIGPLGDSAVDMLGSWIANGQVSDVVTLRAALQERVQAAHGTFHYVPGTEISSDSEAGFAPALAAANAADVVVMALGESGPNMSGEGGSRTRLDLPGNQEQLLEKVVATGKPVALVLFNGHPLALPWAAQHVSAILEAWFPGDQAGPATADVLFGDVNPSGHLPVTVPRSVGQEPLFYEQDNTGRPVKPYAATTPPNNHKNGISRYTDELDDPLFAFGWGLSYTTFAFHNLRLSGTSVSAATARDSKTLLTAAVDVQNTGSRSGEDVVQLYIHRTGTSVAEPLRELRAFRRVSLEPGQSMHLIFALSTADFAVVQPDGDSVIEPLHADIYVGDSSLATDYASVDLLP
jgi:beta-glucosidase